MNGQKYKNYDGSIDFTVCNNSHTQTYIFLQEHCEQMCILNPRVLEVGCSGGYFSKALRDHGFYVFGIEPFTDEAKKSKFVDELFKGTVEDFCVEETEDLLESFDAIILGDVLEHLFDPKSTLLSLCKFLKSSGVFIASVPNVTHIGIQKMLSDGQWLYQKYGILDSTHVRFFSWNSLQSLFSSVELGIERRFDVLMSEFEVYPSVSALKDFNFEVQLRPVEHTFQFVVRASRKAFDQERLPKSLPKNILLISPDPGSSLTVLRLIKPLTEYLLKSGGKLIPIKGSECKADMLNWVEVVIVHREVNIYSVDFVRAARSMGIPVVYDIDDLLTKLPPWSLATLSRVDLILIENFIATSNVVTCTTPRLQTELSKLSDNVNVVPNVIIEQNKVCNPRDKHYSTDCTLIVASSDNVIVDYLLLPVQTLCKVIPSLNVVVIGNIVHRFANITPNLKMYSLCPEDVFSKILSKIDNGIGLIPLDDSLISSCKSPIKYYHYTSCGIVSIASSFAPYIDCIENGKNGILVNNTLDEWCHSILELIKNPKRRASLLSKALVSWKKEASSANAVGAWENVFSKLPKRP